MSKYSLFDAVRLKESVVLAEGGTAGAGTPGAIVEIFEDGKAYLVELFGNWVKYDSQGQLAPAHPDELNVFQETLGVELAYPHQLQLIAPAAEAAGVRTRLAVLLDKLPESLLLQVHDFADLLNQQRIADKSS
ncbi:hypothetical protein [Gloeobacter violaceus]|uniref:hypothetical protein n=1 Tax=Gloeobacter violaceus TaxID=33072 RepID=UPI000314649D|nr:hypothetical protein [Gloeobacter violaceus]